MCVCVCGFITLNECTHPLEIRIDLVCVLENEMISKYVSFLVTFRSTYRNKLSISRLNTRPIWRKCRAKLWKLFHKWLTSVKGVAHSIIVGLFCFFLSLEKKKDLNSNWKQLIRIRKEKKRKKKYDKPQRFESTQEQRNYQFDEFV